MSKADVRKESELWMTLPDGKTAEADRRTEAWGSRVKHSQICFRTADVFVQLVSVASLRPPFTTSQLLLDRSQALSAFTFANVSRCAEFDVTECIRTPTVKFLQHFLQSWNLVVAQRRGTLSREETDVP
jgi:hypothetical protein